MNSQEHVAVNSLSRKTFFFKICNAQTSATFKHKPEDFIVSEPLAFKLEGEGEHLYLQLKKTLCTTHEVKKAIAKWAKVPEKLVSYSGLKDKWAQTIQWFSVHLPGKPDPEISSFDFKGCVILKSKRHTKRIRIGAHKKNSFKIRLRDISNIELFFANLNQIKQSGVPNYFGEQRFGVNRNNLDASFHCLLNSRKCSRQQRALYLSSVRSFLFNEYLSLRVHQGNWTNYVRGDVLQLSGSQSCFKPVAWTDELNQRLLSRDITISGLMPGVDAVAVTDDSLQIQDNALNNHNVWLDYLEKMKVKAHQRSLSLMLEDLSVCDLDRPQDLELNFSLPAGSFATSVLRELIEVDQPLSYQAL